MTYVGRYLQIKSDIFTIANYWMQTFSLSKKVIEHIEGMCRRFLWAGKESPSRKAPIAWDYVCDHVDDGGLNITSVKEWNKATLGKLLWNLGTLKDKMWIQWIHYYYIKKIP